MWAVLRLTQILDQIVEELEYQLLQTFRNLNLKTLYSDVLVLS